MKVDLNVVAVVTAREEWRDASKTYACPVCRSTDRKTGKPLIRLTPGQAHCSVCGVSLLWDIDDHVTEELHV